MKLVKMKKFTIRPFVGKDGNPLLGIYGPDGYAIFKTLELVELEDGSLAVLRHELNWRSYDRQKEGEAGNAAPAPQGQGAAEAAQSEGEQPM